MKSEWISVKDRLPEPGIAVLGWGTTESWEDSEMTPHDIDCTFWICFLQEEIWFQTFRMTALSEIYFWKPLISPGGQPEFYKIHPSLMKNIIGGDNEI